MFPNVSRLIEKYSHKVVYEEINGNKIDLSSKKSQVKGRGLSVNNAKWIKDDLWIKVENYGKGFCGEQDDIKGLENDVWFKPFNKDGTRNFHHYPKGC